jgi:hypothetical protein
LRFAVEHGPFQISDAEPVLGTGWKTIEGHVKKLQGAGLLSSPDKHGLRSVTPTGAALVRVVAAPPGSPVGLTFLAGTRLLAFNVRDPATDMGALETLIRESATAVLRTDGAFDFVGVYPDDHALVMNLRAKARAAGATAVERARVASVQLSDAGH